jgi:2-methylcitrate dehydratase PrpD
MPNDPQRLAYAVGAINAPSARVALQCARFQGGALTATVLGFDTPGSAIMAAYVNGRLANILDADDTFPTATHFGNTTVFAALALAEQLGRSGRSDQGECGGIRCRGRIGSWSGVPIQCKVGKVVGFNKYAELWSLNEVEPPQRYDI